MKRFIICLLALMMTLLALSAALSEELDPVRLAIESFACGEKDAASLDSLLASLPDTLEPGEMVSHTWEGADGATYTLVYYAETAVSVLPDAPAPQPADDALTGEEILQMVDWVETQLRTEAQENTWEPLDQAVFQTALPQPAPAPTVDPAVFYTAQPAPVPTVDPAVFYTAQPAPVPTVDPAVFYTAQPALTPTPESRPVRNTPAPAPRPTARPTNAPTVSTGDYTTFDSTMQEQKLLNLLNADRARNGLPPLTLDPELSRLAQLKSSDMNSNHYFAHESPTYGTAGQMLDTFGYDYLGVGENIAHHANVEKAEAAFMSSDGHRRNILGSQWDKVGIGIAYDENGNVYVTQLFAR